MKRIFFNIAILIAISVANTAVAATYWVDDNGTQTSLASCSGATPISGTSACTLATAEDAVAGDVVNIRGGTYVLPTLSISTDFYWSIAFEPNNSGTVGNPITFQAYDSETVFFDNSNNAGNTETVASYGVYNQTGYIVFDGIDTATAMRSGEGRAVLVKQASNVTIKNAEIEGGSGGTTNNNCIRLEDTSNSRVENCLLWNSRGDSTNSSGMTFYDVTNTTIKNCTFHSSESGIHDKAGSENNTYSHNLFYGNLTEGYGLATESVGSADPHDLRLTQNIFANNDRDLNIRGGQTKSDVIIDNNVFYGAGGGVYFWLGYGITGLDVYNNIFHSKSPATRYESSTSVYSDYNNFYNSTGADSGANSITSNPNFDNAGGNTAISYKRSSYPTDGRGGAYPSVMGAYITGSETIGYDSGGVPAVNGVCGSNDGATLSSLTSVDANNCSTGTVASFSGSGPWSWDCNGSGGGTNDTGCSASLQAGSGTKTQYSATDRKRHSETNYINFSE